VDDEVADRGGPGASPGDPPRRRRVARALLPLPLVAWLLGTPALAVWAFLQRLTFFGQAVTPEQDRAAELWWTWTAVAAVALPVVGLLVAWLARSRRGLWLSLAALVLGLTPVLGWWAVTAEPPEPPPWPDPVCQERSNGVTDCPGG
jgi:fatty acid desaturase